MQARAAGGMQARAAGGSPSVPLCQHGTVDDEER
jgi:hypothetical protein